MRTLYLESLAIANITNTQHRILPNTTLNEYHNVGGRNTLRNPVMKFFTVGQRAIPDANLFGENTYMPYHSNVRKPLPIRLLRGGETLLESETHYRLRKVLHLDGEDYTAFYLKEIEEENDGRYLRVKFDDNALVNLEYFDTETSEILNPTHVINNGAVNRVDGLDTVVFTKPFRMSLTERELSDMKLACRLIYNEDLDLADFLICSGEDSFTSGYVEANGVQGCYFIHKVFDSVDYDKPLSVVHEFGSSDLLSMERL